MSTQSIGVVNLVGITQVAVGIRQFQGAFSEGVATFAPTKRVRPSAPRITSVQPIENAPGTIRISIELPTTNTDGSILQQAELTRIRIYYDDEAGVTEDDPYNEFPVSTTLQFAPGLSGTVYVRAKVQDSHGSWSDLSNEGSANVPEVTPFEFWAHRLGVDSIFTNNSPSAGYVSWSNVKIYFRNEGYTIQNGSTNKRYIYWQKSNPNVFQTSDTVPSLGIEDVLIGTNIDGFWYLAVYHPQVSAEFLRAGKLQSRNWSSSAGAEFDLDAGTFKLGGSSSPKLSWDGTTLSIIGQVTVTGGSVPYSYVTGGPPANADNTSTVIGAGLITTGRILLGSGSSVKAGIDGAGTSDSDIRIWAGATYENRASAPFRVTQGGNVTMTSATITGGVLGGTNVINVTSTGIDVGPYGSIRGGKTSYGSGTGFYLGYSGGNYVLDIGSSSYYLRWTGSALQVRGSIIADTGSSIPGSYLTGSITGIPIYGAGGYPYSYLYSNQIVAYQSAGYYFSIVPSQGVVTDAQGTMYIHSRGLSWVWNGAINASGGNVSISSESGYTISLAAGTVRFDAAYLEWGGQGFWQSGWQIRVGIPIRFGGTVYYIPLYN